ncbi:MAG: metallophosphoesterase family protein [Actinomycetota bacterium]
MMRSRRLLGALATGATLTLIAGAAAMPASAAASPLIEDFTTGSASQAPDGWSVESVNTAGMREEWQGWSFHTSADIVSEWGDSGDRGSFSRAAGIAAVVHSDANRPTSGRFSSTLWSPPHDLEGASGAVSIEFDSHYKQGQSPQTAQLVARVDGGEPVVVERLTQNRLNEAVSVSMDVPADAESVQIGWSYRDSSNNWFWMIDNVEVTESAPADVTPHVVSSTKPVARPGGTVNVRLEGLRPGQQVLAEFGTSAVMGIALADAAGVTSFDVPVPESQPAGDVPLTIGGEGIVSTTLGVTVLADVEVDSSTTEEIVWFDGFEDDRWDVGGSWALSTLDEVVAEYGTDRRHAFTRASGTIAVADAADGPIAGTLTSEPFAVESGDDLELRADSHYRARGASQQGTLTAVFDTGASILLREHTDAEEESTQSRLPFTVPVGASTMTIRVEMRTDGAAGSWMLDDVRVVHPLPTLTDGTPARAVVDIFSDVQGATARLRDHVLPGFRGMPQRADVLVSNGDLVSTGTAGNYDSYLSALQAGGGDDYETVISTMGNHEFYGQDGSAAYIDRFLDRTEMRGVGGQGGLWGEVLVGDELPLLWIGSESYDYGSKNGAGPFVEFSNEQFAWLQERLAYWREQNSPVLLMSHQVLPNSVSGTYARFYANDYGQEEERFAALLADNPNVVMLTGHTHWSPTLNDWSVEHRIDPTAPVAPTLVNTGAVTTMYGPSGDWEETPVGGADPTGIRATLFEDRLRVSVYAFSSAGVASELNSIDVPLPMDALDPTDPTEPTEPTEPTDPTDPTEPTEPTDPTGPTAPTAPTDPTDPSDTDSAADAEGELAVTGGEVGGFAVLAALLFAVGGVLALLRRRRRRT